MAPPAAEPKRSALGLRLLSASVLIPIVLGLVYLGGWYFAVMIAAGAGLMLWEWLLMLYRPGRVPALCAALAFAAAVLLLAGDYFGFAAVSLGAAGALSWIAASPERSRVWVPVGLAWMGLPCVALVWLREAPTGGLAAVCWLLVIIWAADSAAYFAGRAIGGPKLAPAISPNKTWAGLIGGMLGASVISMVFAATVGSGALFSAAALAAVLAPWSQVGDLAESAIKRHVGVKDSGMLIPGHGGILDRVDALLFAAPVVALLTAVWPMGELPWQ